MTIPHPVHVLATALSVLLAALASYIVFEFAWRAIGLRRRTGQLWPLAAGITLGSSVWALHLLALLGADFPERAASQLPTALAALVAVATACSAAFYLVSPFRQDGSDHSLTAGALIGIGFAAQHLIALEAMRWPETTISDPIPVTLSAAVASVAAAGALRIGFDLGRPMPSPPARRPAEAALVMALGTVAMHYLGMEAVTLSATPAMTTDPPVMVSMAPLALGAGTIAGALVLLLALFSSSLDKRLAATQPTRPGHGSLPTHQSVALCLNDREGMFIEANAVCQELLAFRDQPLDRCIFFDFVADADVSLAKEHFDRAVEGAPQSYEVRITGGAGRSVELNVTHIASTVAGEAVILTIATDRAAGPQATPDLRRANDALEQRLREGARELKHTKEQLQQQTEEHERIERELLDKSAQLAAVTEATTAFLETGNCRRASLLLLRAALSQTGSQCGCVGVVLNGQILRVLAHEGIEWDRLLSPGQYSEAVRKSGEVSGLEFADVRRLFGTIFTRRGRPVSTYTGPDRRSAGTKEEDIPLRSFLGVPDPNGVEVVGLIAVANRPDACADHDQPKLEILAQAVGVLYDSYRRREREAALEGERKRAEEQSRERATLLDIADDAILVVDLQDHIQYWNKGAFRLYGWGPEEAIGQRAAGLIYKKTRAEFAEAARMLIQNGEWRGEMQQVTKSGKDIFVDGHWTLVRDPQGRPKSILMVNSDVTDKRQLAQQLHRSQRLESVGRLASGIAHDLNNVMTPVVMAVQLLRLKLDTTEHRKLLDTIEASANRGANLVRQVLSFTRGIEGRRAPVELKQIVAEIEKIVGNTFPRSVGISIRVPGNLWTIVGDSTQLHQVLMNLCVNARDAMPEGGTLQIEAANTVLDELGARMLVEIKPGRYVVLAVTDTGTGIPREILDKIFDPFFTTKEPGSGTGLGLSTAMGILKHHGGTITVSSEVGRGTRFTVYLPAYPGGDRGHEEVQRQQLVRGNGERVLVVDDEASIREMTQEVLETHGYRVMTAGDGAQAAGLYAQHKDEIDVVVTDIMMPGLDGTAMIRQLRGLTLNVKIIAISGLVEHERFTRDPEFRSIRLLRKPFTTEALLTALHDELSGTSASAPG